MSESVKPFKLGFLTHVNGVGKSASQVYSELLDTIQAAEDLGFDGAFVAQHHFQQQFSRLPSPLVLLAAAAARTHRIQLGTGISTIPLEDPLRFAEDVAVLDNLSDGRLQLGLGTGLANVTAFDVFGVPLDEVDARYDVAIDLLHASLEGHEIGTSGLTLQPPAPELRNRLWQSTSRPEKAARIAQAGDGLLIGSFIHRPEDDQRPLVDAYLSSWSRAQPPRIGAVRAVFPAHDRQAALADLGRGLTLFREHVGQRADIEDLDDAQLADRINVHYGSTEEVVSGLRADPALFGYLDYFIPVVQHEASSADEDIRRLEILATEIAPAFGWSPAPVSAS